MDKAAGSLTGAEVRLDRIAFSYGESPMAFDVTIEPASITAIMGPSGSGKSTLLNLVAGFETPQSGRVFIGGVDVIHTPPADRPVSMVFQENNLFAHLDVAANVGLGRSPALRLTADDRAAIEGALAETGLSGKERRLPRELSGGERQRVALARVLVRDRPVLLLDEPFASLGPALRQDMLALVKALHAERRMTILVVTHQPEDAGRIAANIVFLEDGHVAAAGEARKFFGKRGPEAFKRYVGTVGGGVQPAEIARKPT
jgi:thiamine transport system ATP-binding protein